MLSGNNLSYVMSVALQSLCPEYYVVIYCLLKNWTWSLRGALYFRKSGEMNKNLFFWRGRTGPRNDRRCRKFGSLSMKHGKHTLPRNSMLKSWQKQLGFPFQGKHAVCIEWVC